MSDTFEHGYAVVVGVDANQVGQLALPTVAKDVQAVHDVLVHPERCAYKPENVKLLKSEESTRNNIIEALFWLQEKVAKDSQATAIIYYSGHGMEDKDSSKYYLIPYDISSINRIRLNAIEAESFSDEIGAIQAERLLVILDCCHAAGMGVKDIDPDMVGRHPNVEAASFPIDLPAKGIPDYTAVPGSKSAGDLVEGAGRAILNSSTGAQSSYVRKDKTMSLFTYHLIEALTGHAPHPDDATVVYVTDVMSWVTHKVKKSAAQEGVRQTPVMRTSGVFAVAQLFGGLGVAKGVGGVLPDPLAPLPEPPVSIVVDHAESAIITGQVDTGGGDFAGRDLKKTTVSFNQEGQSVDGNQINIGEVEGGVGHIGDVVHGDMVGGDKVEGGKNIISDISDVSGLAIGRGASATVNSGDSYSGDFRGANLNIKSTLADVTQTIGAMPNADDSAKEELDRLMVQLNDLLQRAPVEQQGAAGAVAQTTEMLINTAAAEEPNPTMVQGMSDMLKQTAQTFKNNLPQIIDVTTKIASAVATIAKVAG
jgi:hypothetical protein